MKDKDIRQAVKEHYGQIARGEASCCCPGCGTTAAAVSLAVGYSAEDLKSVPEEAVLGAGCGNPAALADLREGESVLDLGSGAGIDVFLAARRVGERGRVIGVDMTEDMVERGRRLAAGYGYGNVEFRLGLIEQLPLEAGSVDVVISNCVVNLSPDKLATFREAWRVLRPGGRLLVSDLVTVGRLPEEVRRSAAAWAGCIAGAMEREDYLATIGQAGFAEVSIAAQSPYEPPGMEERLRGQILSVQVRALKP